MMQGDKASSAGLAVDPWQSYTSARIIDPRAGMLHASVDFYSVTCPSYTGY